MKAVILAGGKAKRLLPYSATVPKALMPFGEMPILEIILRQLKRAGVDEAIIAVGHLSTKVNGFFKDGNRLGIKIRYSLETKPLGTAGPLSLIEDLDEPFLVANGDVLTDLDLSALIQAHFASDAAATIALHCRSVKVDLGVVQMTDGDLITQYVEKPVFKYQASMGIYVFEPRVLQYIPYDQYLDFPQLVNCLIENGEMVKGFCYEGYWRDVGSLADYEQAVRDFEALKENILGPNGCE